MSGKKRTTASSSHLNDVCSTNDILQNTCMHAKSDSEKLLLGPAYLPFLKGIPYLKPLYHLSLLYKCLYLASSKVRETFLHDLFCIHASAS